MVSPAAAVATTRSVSDANLRSCTEEWPACRGRRGDDLLRPILIFFAATENCFACSSCCDNDVPLPILFFVAAKKNGPPAVPSSRQRFSASDSNLRCSREEWLACSSSRDYDLPRPILIFVAAKKNDSACSGRSGKREWPACSKVVWRRRGQSATEAA